MNQVVGVFDSVAADSHNDTSDVFDNISACWMNIIDVQKATSVLNCIDLSNIVPDRSKIFEFARLTPLDKVRVCIIGQDPYPTPGNAHGLAFSCNGGIPASLLNIYKCLLHNKLIDEMPTSGNLEYWAGQGVLLLNMALTTTAGKSNAHTSLWQKYIREFIERLIARRSVVIFMLWGNVAQKLRPVITQPVIERMQNNAICLVSGHPSPLNTKTNFVLECDNFVMCNKLLKNMGYAEIDWNVEKAELSLCKSFGVASKDWDATLKRMHVAFTDGSCYPNTAGSCAGYAAHFALGSLANTDIYGSLSSAGHYPTNQRAEGMAIHRVICFLADQDPNSWDKVIIVTDSQFWIKMYTKYMPSWTPDTFAKKANYDLTLSFYDKYKKLSQTHDIEFRHVMSHNKSNWGTYPKKTYERFCFNCNDYVDKLASYAREELSRGEEVIDRTILRK